MKRRAQQSSPEHWSKDYVEHLRTVHFALVTVSVALLILLSSQKYDPKAAGSDMARVSNILKIWSGTIDQSQAKTIGSIEDSYKSEPSVDYSAWFDGQMVVKKTFAAPSPSPSPRTVYSFHIAEPNLFECHAYNTQSVYRHFDGSYAPRSIREFRAWWNALDKAPG
jgi:hypothetical protein